MTPQIRKIAGELRRSLSALYGERLDRVVLFGSQAREEGSPASDVDFLVVLRGQVSPGEEITRTSPAVSDLSLEHDVVVSCLFLSADRYEREKSPLLLNVRREGIPV